MKVECVFLKMGIKKEAPSLFCFGMSHQALPTAQCSDGALIIFDLAHIIEVERVIGLDYQLMRPVLFNVKGVSFIEVGELPILWMLRDVVFVTEKRSHASKLQNTLSSVHDGDLILRHQFFATMSSDELKKVATIKEFLFVATILIIFQPVSYCLTCIIREYEL